MREKKVYSFGVIVLALLVALLFQDSTREEEGFSELAKIALRDAGNRLLLSDQDSTSLILPIVKLEAGKFELSFQSHLSFEPSNVVLIIKEAFLRSELPENYIVEVIQCINQEVAYSYKMTSSEHTTIIPCAGRILPENCYSIEVWFKEQNSSFLGQQTLLYLLVFVTLAFVISLFYAPKREEETRGIQQSDQIGDFRFYPEQNKLIINKKEISLSKKECELLVIFVANANKVVKRDELTKRVWEDKGVIVGRSLDTYVSKLRLKLKDDDSLKLTNVHGVGYKLETISS
ncbi:winged helix-turn-helix domain-containing protein [Roseivirga sp.]|uniref:winged helix-turn-helix domain-containing protein n=1 Tax=Roseivirga sp. TaxID=1964215 RepID=UPI003B8CC607